MALAWCFENAATPLTNRVLSSLRSSGTYVLTTALWPFEVASVLTIQERQGRITPAVSAQYLEMLRNLKIQVEMRHAIWVCQEILDLTRTHRLSGYDAA